jgi:hypothetical protein
MNYSFGVFLGVIGIMLTVFGHVIAKIRVKVFPQVDRD